MMIITLLILFVIIPNIYGQEKSLTIPPSNLQYIEFNQFDGGINTVDFVGDIGENELLNCQNLIYQNKHLVGRKGFTPFDTTFSTYGARNVKGITRQYLRDGTKKVYIALGDSIFGSNVGETDFTALTGKIDSTNYVEFQVWNDTTYLVDGGTFQKISGTSLVRANVVDSGRIHDIPTGALGIAPDTIRFSLTPYNVITVNSGQPSTNFPNQKDLWIGKVKLDLQRVLIRFDIGGKLESGDTIISAICSLYVVGEKSAADETLYVKRIGAYFFSTYTWNTQPPRVGVIIDSAYITAPNIWVGLNLTTWVDSVINKGISNQGWVFYLRDSVSTDSAKAFGGLNVPPYHLQSNPPKLIIARIPKTKIPKISPSAIRDTLRTNRFTDGELKGYFIEFSEQATTSMNQVRLITNNIGDTIYFTPRLTDISVLKQAYKIVALPSSIEKVYPKGAESKSIDSVTTEIFSDSTRRVWIGDQDSIGSFIFRGGTYFLKVVQGTGLGDYQILSNVDIISSVDYVVIYSSSQSIFDSTSRFEIYQRVFPSPKHFAINKSRFWLSDTLHFGRLWFSEVNKPGAVGAFNFHTLGGDPAEGEITYLGGLYVSNFADPQNPLVIGRENAIYAEYGDNPTTDFPRKIISNVGISSAYGVIPHAGALWFNHRSKYYAFDGKDVTWISKKLAQPYADSLGKYSAGYLLDKKITFNIPKSNQSNTFHLESGQWTGTHTLGFTVASGQQSVKDSIPVILGAFEKGKVYNFGLATTDGGNNIPVKIQSKYFNLNHADISKHLREFVLDYGITAGNVDVLFYSGDGYPTTSTDSIRVAFVALGNRSDKKYLTGASWGRNFSFVIKADAASNFKIGKLSLGLETYPITGFGN